MESAEEVLEGDDPDLSVPEGVDDVGAGEAAENADAWVCDEDCDFEAVDIEVADSEEAGADDEADPLWGMELV